MKVEVRERVGDFAEDKDAAASIRKECIEPSLAANRRITLDFTGVTLTTQ